MELLHALPRDIQEDIAKRLSWTTCFDFHDQRLYISVWDLMFDVDGASELAYLQMLATVQPPIFDCVWLEAYHSIRPRGYCGFALYQRESQRLIDFVARHFTQFPHLEIIIEEPPTDELATGVQFVVTPWKWRLVVLEIARIERMLQKHPLSYYFHTRNHRKEADMLGCKRIHE